MWEFFVSEPTRLLGAYQPGWRARMDSTTGRHGLVELSYFGVNSGCPWRHTGRCLTWGHLAPTTPDTLGLFPYSDQDPHVLTSLPDVLVAGNQEQFLSKEVRISLRDSQRMNSVDLYLIAYFYFRWMLMDTRCFWSAFQGVYLILNRNIHHRLCSQFCGQWVCILKLCTLPEFFLLTRFISWTSNNSQGSLLILCLHFRFSSTQTLVRVNLASLVCDLVNFSVSVDMWCSEVYLFMN